MIPRRVRLKGFLCYKEEQAIDFDGTATLWMLSGLNGSGKSAIFDAVTYALFAYHRGGSRDAHELINKDSDALSVEFDFLLDGHDYRAKRTLKRDPRGGAKGATQQIFRCEPGANGAGKWEAVKDTGLRREFDVWIKDNVGLDYDTFTSSVLLLQGKAEKLLDSRPEGRREVLAGIVDLGRYERLHQKADERRKTLEGALKSLTGRLNAVPAVVPLELVEARTRIQEAEEARDAARAEVERLQQLEFLARTYQELRGRLDAARKRLDRAKGVLGDAGAIEQAVERLRELREVYPRLREIAVLRGQASQAESATLRLNDQRRRQVDEHAAVEAALSQAREKRATIQAGITRDETANRGVSERLGSAKVKLEKLGECERHEGELERLRADLKALPADPQGLLALARDDYDRLESLARVVPVLGRFASRRQELQKAVDHEKAVEASLLELEARAKARKKEAEDLRPRLDQAAAELTRAGEEATEARTLLAQAERSVEELTTLDGSKVCRHCGQPLTEGHLGEEKRRRTMAAEDARGRARATESALKTARSAEQELRKKVTEATGFVEKSRDDYRDGLTQRKQARADVDRWQAECAVVYGDLPEELSRRISPAPPADWLTTAYPRPADLAQLTARASGLDAARRKKTEAETASRKHGELRAKEGLVLETVQRLLRDLPADRDSVRGEYAELIARAKALFGGIDAGRKQLGEIDREADKLTRQRDQTQAAILETDGHLKEQQLVGQNAARGTANLLRELPEAWRGRAEKIGIKEQAVLQEEMQQLERDGTDEQARELEAARHGLSEFDKDVKELQGKEAASPAEVKQEPAVLAALLREGRSQDKTRDDLLSQARKQLALLESFEQQRAEIDKDYRATEKELTTHRLLSELLGRERLQLYLVRQAERQVVEYANAVLDRLSGGQLYLRLSGEAGGDGTSAKALELEAYNRVTGEKPINVAFLSGSQKFRVAVSLALGIGQYASRQHRPIESVIIDEGFGCLDSQGRQVMIQELQNLRSQMRCILLVSHQEDFAEAFSDGYHFHLEQGATKVKRVQK